MAQNSTGRIVFLDYLRFIACFLVLLTHANEPVYLGGMGTSVASPSDAFWSTFFICLCRCCVPLFVIASSYLMFPLPARYASTRAFFKKRLVHVGIPALVWLIIYSIWGGGAPADNFARLPFNFPAPAGHLWFCYMILGLYLLMPLLSPWAENVGKKELRAWIGIWLFTTLIPFVRQAAMHFTGDLDTLSGWGVWGEANWSEFGTFYYVSGFFGYLLIGLYFKKYYERRPLGRTLAVALPLFAAGFALAAVWFYGTMPKEFPFDQPIRTAVVMETALRFCSLPVALMTVAVFMCISCIKSEGAFYRHIVLPFSKASYGVYLCHILALVPLYGFWRGLFGNDCFWDTPAVVLCTAVSTFAVCGLLCCIVKRIPVVGKYIVG